MNAAELSAVQHAHSLIRDLAPEETGYHQFIAEATDTLAGLLDAQTDTPAQILHLVTNA